MKAPVLKTGIPQGIGGSNPSPSAKTSEGGLRPPFEPSPKGLRGLSWESAMPYSGKA